MSEFVITGRDVSGQPVYGEVLSSEEIVEKLKATAEWRDFKDKFDMSKDSNNTLLGMVFDEKLGDDPSVEDYQRLIKTLFRAGGIVLVNGTQYEFELKQHEPEPAVEPDVPRDRNGNPLTASQLQWRQFAIWANDSNTSSEMIRQRRQNDRSFAEFYRRSLEREASETPSTQFQLAGLPSGQTTASEKLKRFAKLYQDTSTDRLKPRGGYITLTDEFKLTKSQFDNFVTQAADAGLL